MKVMMGISSILALRPCAVPRRFAQRIRQKPRSTLSTANLSISSSGTTPGTAIVWAVDGNGWPTANNPAPAVLYAFDAQHLTSSNVIPELWASSNCPTRDKAGNATKFVLPTIANGFVYLGSIDPTDPTNTRGELDVFGLTSAACK